MMVRDAIGTTYTHLDPLNQGGVSALANVDSFYQSILVPTAVFTRYMAMLHTSFNVSGPAQGKLFCDAGPKNGNCWV